MAGCRLLVVDDDRSQSSAVATLLANHGYRVDIAGNGPEALGLLADHRYALVVLDYQMPGMNGVELFERARFLQPELVGVLLTAFTGIRTVFPAIDAGVDRVLAKPVNAEELLPLVAELTASREVQ
jgi:CheY-like chemotaxis protein